MSQASHALAEQYPDKKPWRVNLYIEPSIRTIAGGLIILFSVLVLSASEYKMIWLSCLFFIGFNLFQSGLTGFCLMEKLLKTLGFRSELNEIRTLSKELKQTTEQQADHLETLSLLNEAVIELTTDGKIISVSDGWLKITGESNCNNASGKPLGAYMLSGDHAALENAIQSITRKITPTSNTTFRLFIPDKGTKWVNASFTLAEHDNGATIKGVLSDISESKRLLEERKLLSNELTHARRLSNLGEMAASLAHELNQPLAAINLYIQGCMKRMDETECNMQDIRDVMQLASKQAKRAGDIIKQMRSYVQKKPLDLEPTDINQLIKETLGLIQNDHIGEDIYFDLQLDSTIPSVQVDRLQIQQVLVNLITNAVDAMKEKTGLKKVVIHSAYNDDKITVEVIDEGKGIPEDISDNLFEPFVTARKDGLGLGLAISRSIIEEHHGVVCYKGLETDGSCFCFTLPVQHESREP